MGLDGYVGSSEDQNRIRRLERERQEQKDRIEKERERIEKPVGFRSWHQATVEVVETAFKADTVGLISRDEYLQRKATMEERLQAEEKERKRKAEAQRQSELAALEAERDKKRKQTKLSFLDDDDDNGDGPSSDDDAAPRLVKDPDVETGFLPDKRREAALEESRAALCKQWHAEQEALKHKVLKVTFSYWDGSGHQSSASVSVGDTIAVFLKAARTSLEKDFPQLRHAAVSNLLLVSHNVIVPQSCTFHRLIVGRAQNSSGERLFELEGGPKKVHSVKVVQRHWYESNKHIYPANSWQMFDEDVHMA